MIGISMVVILVGLASLPNEPMQQSVSDPLPNASCAIELRVTATIRDLTGAGVSGAELWYLQDLGGFVPPTTADRIGVSDARGFISADLCYMSEMFYCAKRPAGERTVRFMVLKEGWGVVRLEQRVSSELLLKEGLAIRGKPCTVEAVRLKKGDADFRAYLLPLKATLKRVP